MISPLLLLVFATLCFSFSQPLCSERERTLLLQFKESFAIEKFSSQKYSGYPKTDSWGRNGSDCCVWDGVKCDEDRALVIGLDLRSSFLYGSIGSNSTLFGLTDLESLNLADNHFNYSRIPASIGRLVRLTHLDLSASFFSGQIPHELLSLPRLSFLVLHEIYDVPKASSVELKNPSFHDLVKSLTGLKLLSLAGVDISAGVSESLGNISSLKYLKLQACGLKGVIPSSIGKLHLLIDLDLSSNYLTGQIPSSLENLTQLKFLDLSENNFESGPIPSFLENLTQLVVLKLANSQLIGPIPLFFPRLVELISIDLQMNNLSGEVDFDIFLGMKQLTHLKLSYNRLSVLNSKPTINEKLPQLIWLALTSCNLIEFPKFLRHQQRLLSLNLDDNLIGGDVPKWFWNTSTQTLKILSLDGNFLTGHLPPILPFINLISFGVSNNLFVGSLPIPPPSVDEYLASSNSFSGQIPTLFCNLDSAETSFSSMKMIDLSHNKLQGKLPHSLANCTMLQYLNVEYNQLDDLFPHWLGTLSRLEVLLLRSNRFHGKIIKPKEDKSRFPRVQILVLSYNNFTGPLPSPYFKSWKAMQSTTTTRETKHPLRTTSEIYLSYYKLTIAIKGTERFYGLIHKELCVMDLSHNSFIGEIPETIKILKRLVSLDLSKNNLRGHIPPSLKSLKKLESLDLSSNKLSGTIPQELTQLTFLQYFNVSHNRLEGRIPQQGQLGSMASTCYEGNPGLCGIPLQSNCKDDEASEPQTSSSGEEQADSSSTFHFGWEVVVIGFVCGLIGVVIWKIVVARKKKNE